jgi:hypothetical protein
MSTINAITSPVPAVITTTDNTGNLAFQTAGTTVLNLDTNQNATFTGSVSATNTFGFKNRIINGNMIVNQRTNTSITITSSNSATYGGSTVLVDRIILPSSTASSGYATPSAFTCSITNNAASIGFPLCYSVAVNTAGVGGSNRDIAFLSHKIEIGNLIDLGWGTAGAQPVTLSFWMRSSLPGQRSIFIYNPVSNRYIQPAFNINSANTWEFKTITLPGDTAGSFGTTLNNEALRIEFRTSCSGTSLAAATNTWGTLTGQRGATGDVDFFGTQGATLDFAGLQLEKGTVATPFDFRPYGTELALCMRYFQSYKNAAFINSPYINNLNRGTIPYFVVPMRIAPTFTFYDMYSNSGFLTEFSSQTQRTVNNYSSSSPLGGGYVQTSVSFGNPIEVRFEASAEF